MSDMTRFDAETPPSAHFEPRALYGIRIARKRYLRTGIDCENQVPQGDACRIPARAERDDGHCSRLQPALRRRGSKTMGKVTGFLEIDRQDRKYAPASDRIRHYKEFVLPLSEAATKEQASRCMNCGIPYCHNGCPVNNQIPTGTTSSIAGDWEEACRNLHSTNNFPRSDRPRLPRALRGLLHAEHRGYSCHDQDDRMRHRRSRLERGLDQARRAQEEDRQESCCRRFGAGRNGLRAAARARAGHECSSLSRRTPRRAG